MSLFEYILGWVLIVGLPLALIGTIIRRLVLERRKTRRILKEWESPSVSPSVREYHGTVVEKQCYTEESGLKTPRHHRRFGIRLRTDDGKHIWFAVEEAVYHTIREHAVGTLAVVGDRVYGFSED